VTFPQIKKTVNMRHNVRMNLTQDKKRSVQYALDKRREERGTKVIHVHEKPAARKLWPSTEEMERRILEYFRVRGELPQVMQVPFQTDAPSMAYAVSGLPPDPEWTLKDGRRLVEMRVEIADSLGLR
jgi:hypothetical protein